MKVGMVDIELDLVRKFDGLTALLACYSKDDK